MELDTYKGMSLVHHGAMKKRSLETLSHTALSVQHLVRHRTDAAVVFNAANAPFLPALRAARIPVATHVDGLEWKRDKWGGAGRRYYLMAERLAVKWSDALIADAVGIQDYYLDKFAKPTDLITYGAPILDRAGDHRLAELGLTSGGYHLVVARFEPENHVDMIVEGYAASAAELPADRRRLRAVRRRLHPAGALAGRRPGHASSAASGTRNCWTSCTPTPSPTCTGTRSAAPTRRCCVRSARRRRPPPSTSTSTARCSATPAGTSGTAAEVRSQVEASERDVAETVELGTLARVRANKYDWDEVADRYEDLCLRLAGRDRALASSRRRPPLRGPI